MVYMYNISCGMNMHNTNDKATINVRLPLIMTTMNTINNQSSRPRPQ